VPIKERITSSVIFLDTKYPSQFEKNDRYLEINEMEAKVKIFVQYLMWSDLSQLSLAM